MVDRELPTHNNANSRLTDALKEEFCRTYNRRYKVLEWMKSNKKKICKRCQEKNLDCIHPSAGSTQCTHCRGDGHCSKTLAHKKYQVLELMGIDESLFLELREWYDAKSDTEEGSDAEPGETDTVKEKSVKATKSTPREIKVGGKESGASISAGTKTVSSGRAMLSGTGGSKRRTLAGSSRNATRNTESQDEDESEKNEQEPYPAVSSKHTLKRKLDCERTSPDRDVKNKPSPNKKGRQSNPDCDDSDLEVSQLLEDDILDSPLAGSSTGKYATHKPSSSGFLTSPSAAKKSKCRPKSLSVVPETASEHDTGVNGHGADARDNTMSRRKMARSPRVARPTGVPLSSSGSFRPLTAAGVTTKLRSIKRAFEDVTTEIRYDRSDLRTCVDRLETTLTEFGGVIAEMEG
ncbi:hypothetical protein VNI00_004219 [Paramarasmius palmivorus]|uniref:Zn(2)-C6 fungal-type domain-containing protein n=1 Tax=Paramarasmius palmivorus TaxID=297713 RepID=A0AAW0DP02_9AGAR